MNHERGKFPIIPKKDLGIEVEFPDEPQKKEDTPESDPVPTPDSGRAPLGVVIDKKRRKKEEEESDRGRYQPEMPPPPPGSDIPDEDTPIKKNPERGIAIIDYKVDGDE